MPSCQNETSIQTNSSIEGSWKLLTGTLVEKGDTVITDYSDKVSMIKIINATHFSFLSHDLKKGVDSTATFSAGAGPYTLSGDEYTEYLEYCSYRPWEGNTFHFTVTFRGDTLIQNGVEKVEELGVERVNIEKYVRIMTPQ
jgi:hypothetical protein